MKKTVIAAILLLAANCAVAAEYPSPRFKALTVDTTITGATNIAAHVTTNAALAASTTTQYPNGVWRDAYSAGVGSPLFFAPQTGTCAANSLTNDGGYCVNDAGSNSFVAKNNGVFDPAQFGAKYDGVTYDDDAFQAAANAICATGGDGKLEHIGSTAAVISPAGVDFLCPMRIASPKADADAAATYDPGITTTKTVTEIYPNNSTPSQTRSVWDVGDVWPYGTVAGRSNDGGLMKLSITWTTAKPTIAVGQYIAAEGAAAAALRAPLKVTAITSTGASSDDITVNLAYSAISTGGTILGPVPRALFNVYSQGVVFEKPIMNLQNATGSCAIANYGVNQSGGREFLVEQPTITAFGNCGIVTAGQGATSQIAGGNVVQGVFSSMTNRTGHGLMFIGGSADSRARGVVLAYAYAPWWTDARSNDNNLNDMHVYNGLSTGAGGPLYYPICGEFRGTGSYSGTNDNCTINIIATATNNYAVPLVQISANSLPEYYGTGLIPSAVQFICRRATTGGCATSASTATPIGISPQAYSQYPITGYLGGVAIKRLLTLVDSDGLYFSKAWGADSLSAAANLNNLTGSASNPYFNIFGGTAISFAGTSSTSNLLLTSADLYPTIGAAMTDTATCLPASAKVGFYNPLAGTMYIAGGATATCTSAGDTITVGTRTFTGTLTSGSAFITSVSFGTIRKGLKVSGTNIPSDSWLDGIGYYSGTVSFDNPSRSVASGSGATTVTTDAGSYAFQPDDDNNTFLVTSAKTLKFNPFVPTTYGWKALLINNNTATTVQALGGTSTVNGSTAALTLTTAYKAVWLLSAGNLGSGNARFIVSQ